MQPDKVTQIVGLVIASVFITGLALEFLLVRLLKKNYFSSEFLIINLSIASLQQLTDAINKLIFVTAFVFVAQHYSIQKLSGWKELETINPFSLSPSFPFLGIKPLVLLNYILVLIIADFCQYWLHRFSHEVNIMWAGHITHHSNTEYNFGVALRQNALENLYTWVFFMPLAFFGIPWQMFIAAYAVSLIWQFLVHTRMVNKLGALEIFMSTPSHHRVHHGKNPQYIDKNYGAFFIVWDKLFGTFEPEVEEVQYGILKPLNNQNPVWSNVHHHLHIIKTATAAKNWSDKLKVVFGRPAFIPSNLGVEPVRSIETRFTPQPEKKLYVFINFLFVAVVIFWGVNQYEESHNLLFYLFASVFTLCSFSILTGLLENRLWADHAEIARLSFIALAGLYISFGEGAVVLGMTIFGVSVLFFLATVVIAFSFKKRFPTAL